MTNNLTETMQKSFDYWSWVDEDSRLNCLSVWKTVLKNNSEILKNQTIIIDGIKQNATNYVTQFLESWSQAIEEPDFESAKKLMEKWQDLWEKKSDENMKIFVKVLEMLEEYWNNVQNKSIE